MAKDQQLERQYRVAAEPWRPGPANAISHKRAQLTMWPGMLVGSVVVGIGLVLLDLRRRRQIEWEMEERLGDGRPLAFRASGREPE
jgi:Tfp pilus assembly protein PilN